MIFYFSGTGNSLYTAKKLADQMGCEIVDMAAGRKEKHEFHLKNEEPVGFVFPVYCYTLNDVVFDYIQNLEITGNGYTFAIVTCGASIGGTAGLLKSELKKRGIDLANVYPLVMPDNAMFYYNIADKKQAKEFLAEADKKLDVMMEKIQKKEVGAISSGLSSRLLRPVYHAMASTKKFSVTDECIHCGKCERNCPDQVIKMKDGIPTWEKSKCVKCSACINRCPVNAIQYGKGTRKRNRYENPYI
ncbi:MAG: 4Fe-4S dicluster domain-containing protein [Lachnospiraceae bacterium]|nr:4Fe-4S dicluster domain-containing protein [Lachnospiraceae bacterium]